MKTHFLRAICRLLLAAYPRAFRARFGAALTRDFASAGANGGAFRNAVDLFIGGLGERRAARRAGRHITPSRQRMSLQDLIMNDVRLTLRNLLTRPAYALLVIATLAVGIGANTAVFSLVDGVLLREMPYKDSSRLAFMWTKLDWIGVPRAWIAGPHIPLLGRELKTIESIAGIRTGNTQLTGSGEPQMLRLGLATGNLFDVLGVPPAHGRTFTEGDRGSRVAVLTHGLWRRQFGADPAIVGRTIELATERYDVIGVMPEAFGFLVHSSLGEPVRADLWTLGDWNFEEMNDGGFSFAALVRAKPDVDLAAVQAEADVLGESLDKKRYRDKGFGWHVAGLKDDLVAGTRPGLLMLAAAALGTLLIVCANVAGLGLVEISKRRRETAVRLALGASRGRIVTSHIVESVTLSMLGGAGGALIAWLALRAVTASTLVSLPRLDEIALDWRVLLFTLALSIAAGIAAGVLPALRSSRPNLTSTLRDGGRGATAQGTRARALLIAAELALAVMLLASAGVLLRSFAAMQRIDPGFNAEGVLTANIALAFAKYPEEQMAWQFHRQIAERVSALPGVTAIGAANATPLSGDADQSGVLPEGWSGQDEQSSILVDFIRSTPGYFRAMGIQLLRGRDFTWDDRSGMQRVGIIDEIMARRVWPDADPIGRTLVIDGETKVQVVGVVRQGRLYSVHADDRPQLFLPWQQDTTLGLTLAVRTTGDPSALAGPLRQSVWALDPNQPVAKVTPMTAVVDLAMAERRLQLILLTAFAACAVLLASIGLYGMISSTVTQRTQEMGVRAALGASAGSIRGLVMRRALLLALAGVAAGLLGALAVGGVLSRFSFGVTGRDPLTLAATVAVLLGVALLAAYVPARRASRVDPLIALRDA